MASLIDRILARSGPSANGCIEWRGYTHDGYGMIRDGGRRVRVHRALYEAVIGEIVDPATCVCHRCDNRICVNLEHMFLGTRAENNFDKVAKGRQARGREHGVATQRNRKGKLDQEMAATIRRLVASGSTQRDVAKSYGVRQSTVSLLVNNKLWRVQ